MRAPFLTQADLDGLPEDPKQRFVAIEALCRTRLYEEVDGEEVWAAITDARLRYMSTVITAARYLKIESLGEMKVPRRSQMDDNEYEDFVQELQCYIVQLMLAASDEKAQVSIVLEGSTRQRLETLLAHVRSQIPNLALSAGKLSKLNSKIDAFERELEGARLQLVAVGVFTLGVAAAISDLSSAGSVIRQLVNQIEETVGLAKETQDEAAAARIPNIQPRRLEAPLRAEPVTKPKRGGDFDDEIPF